MTASATQLKKQAKLPDLKVKGSSTNPPHQHLHTVLTKKEPIKKLWYLMLVVVPTTLVSMNWEPAFLKYIQPMAIHTWARMMWTKKLSTGWQMTLKRKKILIFAKIQWPCNV